MTSCPVPSTTRLLVKIFRIGSRIRQGVGYQHHRRLPCRRRRRQQQQQRMNLPQGMSRDVGEAVEEVGVVDIAVQNAELT